MQPGRWPGCSRLWRPRPLAPRPRLETARLQHQQADPAGAVATLLQLATDTPQALPLAAPLLVQAAQAAGQGGAVLRTLQRNYSALPSLDVLDAIVALEDAATPQQPGGRQWYVHHLETEPSLVAATKWLQGERLENEQFHPQVQRALERASAPLMRYRCAACGFEARQHFWQCPGCQSWDSYPAQRIEEI